MSRKIIALAVISMFIATSSIAVAMPITVAKNSTHIELSKSSESHLFKSITISDVITLIKEQLDQIPLKPIFKNMLKRFIEKGVSEIEEMGITSEKNLLETENILTKGLFNRKPRSRSFLINLRPDATDVTTSIPPFVINLSKNNESENVSLEIFIKLIPLFDSIQTEQRIILRKLYQSSSLLWPAIGARILEDNVTSFILAFGPGFQWTWRIF